MHFDIRPIDEQATHLRRPSAPVGRGDQFAAIERIQIVAVRDGQIENARAAGYVMNLGIETELYFIRPPADGATTNKRLFSVALSVS